MEIKSSDCSIKEATKILKELSPKNQSYLLTLARLAQVAENNVRDSLSKQQSA